MDKESETAGIISLASEGKWDIILISHSKRKSVIAVAIHSTLHRNKHLYTRQTFEFNNIIETFICRTVHKPCTWNPGTACSGVK